MDSSGSAGFEWSQPPLLANPTLPRAIGILNMTFGILLLLCIGGCAVQLAAQAAVGPMMSGAQGEQMRRALQQAREEQIRELREQEEAAQTEEEQAELRARREQIEAAPPPKPPDFSKLYGVGSRLVITYYSVDLITGFLLNVAMLVAGIALVSLKEWGRRLALWVAGLKIVRLFASELFFIMVVVPRMSKDATEAFQQMFQEMEATMPPGAGGPGAEEFSQMGTQMGVMMGTMWTAAAVGTLVLGIIYPIVVLAVLTRPSAKAACH